MEGIVKPTGYYYKMELVCLPNCELRSRRFESKRRQSSSKPGDRQEEIFERQIVCFKMPNAQTQRHGSESVYKHYVSILYSSANKTNVPIAFACICMCYVTPPLPRSIKPFFLFFYFKIHTRIHISALKLMSQLTSLLNIKTWSLLT